VLPIGGHLAPGLGLVAGLASWAALCQFDQPSSESP
jgi:hypothetical protein